MFMHKIYVFTSFYFVFSLLTIHCFGQQSGTIEIKQDPLIETLVQKHVAYNLNKVGIRGYRVQIFFESGNNSKAKANAVKAGFLANFPNVGAYLTYQAPNYKIRVGDFRSKLDAYRFLRFIAPDYSNAFIVSEEIHYPSLDLNIVPYEQPERE